MHLSSKTFLHQQAIQARCFHPSGAWTEFPHAALEGSIVARFEKIVGQLPNQLAIKQGDRCLTYAELNGAANRVAHALLEQRGAGAEPIALLFEHGIEMVIALLGVLKAGKFYVPLSAHEPVARTRTMLADVQTQVLLTNRTNHKLAQRLVDAQVQILKLEDCTLAWADANPNLAIGCDAFAYIIYTSGSTGQPKGVIETHRNVLHFVMTHSHCEHYVPGDRCGLTRAYTFSGTASLLFSGLLNGAALFPYDLAICGVDGLAEWFTAEAITAISLAPAVFRQFAGALQGTGHFPALRLLRLGGDRVIKRDVELYQRYFSANCLFQVGLGTTEVKLITNYFVDQSAQFQEEMVPIGYPVQDIEVLILDEAGNELGFDQIGEIAVRSRYVSPGYWRKPALTAARFLPVPTDPTKRIYLTGDLGKLRADGCLFHLGRNDAQVKIQGQLVATLEVETALLQVEGVKEAVVAAHTQPEGVARLIAYVVTQQPTPTVTHLRNALSILLPTYMMPASFVFLDALPLNANHKIDRRALPKPDGTRPAQAVRYEPPQSALEAWLVACWEVILAIQPVGIDDNFLELGGDSLKGMQILLRLQDQLGEKLYYPPFFQSLTIRNYAHYLRNTYPVATQNTFGLPILDQRTVRIQPETAPQPDRLSTTAITELRKRVFTQYPASYPVVAKEQNPPAIFILAPSRSGTTLLRVLLGGHPQLFAPPELDLLNYTTLAQRRTVTPPGQNYRLEGTLQALMTIKGYHLVDAEAEMARYEAQGMSTQAFYRLLQSWIAPRLLVDKTPGYANQIMHLHYAELAFKEPRYIHLTRHPYAMIHSFVSERFDQMNPLSTDLPLSAQHYAELTWLNAHQNILDFLRGIPADRQQRICFEALLQTPTAILTQLCHFLAIAMDPAMLLPYQDAQQRMTDSIHPLTRMKGDPRFHTHNQIDPSVADRWREHYTTDFLSDLTWTVAERLGYQQADLPAMVRGQGPPTLSDGHDDLEQVVNQLEALSDEEATLLLQ